MGRIGKLISFLRVDKHGAKVSDATVDPGGGANISAEHFGPPGDDSHPLPGDYVAISSVAGTGREVATGYVDPVNDPIAEDADKRIYARDKDTGVVVVELWLKNDGTAVLSNDNGSITLRPDGGSILTTPNSVFDAKADGSIKGANANGDFELEAGGDFKVNGVTIAANGDVDIPSSLMLNGKELDGHTHAINTGSSAPGPTGGNN